MSGVLEDICCQLTRIADALECMAERCENADADANKEDINSRIFDNIKAVCKERNLPISVLERTVGLGNGTISGWNESSPRLDKIVAVAKALDVPLTTLVFTDLSESCGSYARFSMLLDQRHLRASDVTKATGISAGTLTDWKMGRYTPKADKMIAIANYFGVPVEYFLTVGSGNE